MFICERCGHLEEELKTERYYDDNLLGGYMDEEVTTCPHCKRGEMIEATQCEVCGEWFDNSEFYGVCKNCLEEHETVGDALAIGDKNRTEVEINSFIATILSVDHINHILEKWVEENFTDHSRDVVMFLHDDLQDFTEYVKKQNEAKK